MSEQDQGVTASPPGCQPSASAADASSQSGIPNAGNVSWHCSVPDGGPDVGVSLVLAPGVNLWCGEIPDQRLAEASDDVRAFADAAYGWWLVLYMHDGATVIGRVGAEEGRALLEERLAPALRAAAGGVA